MSTPRDVQRDRAVQVGFVMRAYRESFQREDGRKGLSQEELLERMALVDENYPQRFSHTTVSRWESGITRPSGERIRVFGKALGLSETEIDGLFLLAGLPLDSALALARADDWEGFPPEDGPELDNLRATGRARSSGDALFVESTQSMVMSLARFVFIRALPLAMWIVVLGYAMSFLDWDGAQFPIIYVGLVVAAVMAQGFVFPCRDVPLREFFWISIFLVLSTPLLQFSLLQMDHYNFYTLERFSNMPIPYVLALLLNLTLSCAAGMLFDAHWRRKYRRVGARREAFKRAAWVAFLPILLVFGVVMVITNVGVTIQVALLFSFLASAFASFLLLRDPALNPGERDQRVLFPTVMGAAIVGGAVGLFIILFVYASHDLPRVLPDHNLVTSWEIDFDALGFTREEALQRINLGYLWHAMCIFVYTLLVVGGRLLVDIYRIGGGDAAENRSAESQPVSDFDDPSVRQDGRGKPRRRDALPLSPVWNFSRSLLGVKG